LDLPVQQGWNKGFSEIVVNLSGVLVNHYLQINSCNTEITLVVLPSYQNTTLIRSAFMGVRVGKYMFGNSFFAEDKANGLKGSGPSEAAALADLQVQATLKAQSDNKK
jgi:hypothetical protein